MTPRRLIPYLVVFLVVLGVFLALSWQQRQKEALEQRTKKVAEFKGEEISSISLTRGKEEVQLTREGGAWQITKPLKGKAEAATVDNLVQAMASLKKERDLGAGDFKAYGLEPPVLLISFTAKGEQHQLALGSLAPGSRGYYARKDNKKDVFLINTTAFDGLNQQLRTLRDKTLLAFDPEQVKAVKLRSEKTQVEIEKTGPEAWRRVGQPDFRAHPDRFKQFLKELQMSRINEFPPAPKDLKAVGLAPQAKAEVTLTTPQGIETLYLGNWTGAAVYVRVGAQDEVVQVNKNLPQVIAQAIANLEDRRLWVGTSAEVNKLVWRPPGKTWTAVREEKDWKVTGPAKEESRPTVAVMDMVMLNLKNLEYTSRLPQAGTGKAVFAVELLGKDDKLVFRLEELGKKGDGVEVRAQSGAAAVGAIVSPQKLEQWKAEITRLTNPPPKPAAAQPAPPVKPPLLPPEK